MKKSLIVGMLTAVSLFSATFKTALSSNIGKAFIGGSINTTTIGFNGQLTSNVFGVGVTGGYIIPFGKNNFIVDASLDVPGAKYDSIKARYSLSMALKYAFNIFDNLKTYAGASFHYRKYKAMIGGGNSIEKEMDHIAAVIGVETKINEKFTFFGELHYFISGGQEMMHNMPESQIKKGNVTRIGTRYYF